MRGPRKVQSSVLDSSATTGPTDDQRTVTILVRDSNNIYSKISMERQSPGIDRTSSQRTFPEFSVLLRGRSRCVRSLLVL